MAKKIAIQGDKASFHDIAAGQLFGTASRRLYCDTFVDAFKALVAGEVDYALCSIENSLYGSIREVYDQLVANKLYITGEIYLRVKQCLIGFEGVSKHDITKVYSHPVALAQCEKYLDRYLPQAEREEHHDTAASVKLIKQLADPTLAAIASREAAQLYGLNILGSSIETNRQNFTHFIALSKTPNKGRNLSKTSMIIETNHQPGTLYTALGVFAKRSIDLTKVESRPVIGRAWHYMFYIDVELNDKMAEIDDIIRELIDQGCTVIHLGSYPKAKSLT